MKNIYITWHYTTHGIAFLKHILSAFHQNGLPENEIKGLNQEELNDYFDNPKEKGFRFDKIIYLTAPQEAFDNLSARRFEYKDTILKDEEIEKLGLKEIFKDLLKQSFCYQLDEELDYVQNKYPQKAKDFEKVIWRNIQHYPIEEQLKWLNKKSNYSKIYDKLIPVELDIRDLRDEKLIADRLGKWLKDFIAEQKRETINLFINVSLGSNETQVIWHILAESNQLPDTTRFIKTYDDKNKSKEKRFKEFSIKDIPHKLLSNIIDKFSIYPETQSPKRSLVDEKLKVFLTSGFAILLIGERGIGKSQIAREAQESYKELKGKIVEVNCASFDDDSKAEAELFGYEKGAFTGADSSKKGLLEEANKGILFLDEIHHLSKFVQAKLMKALQTDKENKMSIRKMGSNEEIKVECRLIFATNRSIPELRNELLPDFYDRIVQHVVNIPALRDTIEDRVKDWENVWKNLKFSEEVPKELKLINWLKKLPLDGNYRDLQKIAMYYNIFNSYDDKIKEMLPEKSAFQYAKNEFEKYHSPVVIEKNEKYNFSTNKTTKEMINEYKFELREWAIKKFKGRKNAVRHFNDLKDSITEKTFDNWKNKQESKISKE